VPINDRSAEFSRSFGSVAARYARYRPSYPSEAIDHVLTGLAARIGSEPQRILDLGAGTGKLTAALIGRAPEVVAVEPDEAMLAQLPAAVPGAISYLGSAESIPLPDRSVDAIFVGQAFHWFPRPEADLAMARVLRPGGVVGLIWNIPDPQVEWVRKFFEAIGDENPPWKHSDQALEPELFTDAEQTSIRSEHLMDGPDDLINLAHTRSWVITQPAGVKATINTRLHALIAEYPQLQAETLSMPQTTKIVRQYRR
jgi:ubiquinone/menaquinone biosynthesis C-methylase UbiE